MSYRTISEKWFITDGPLLKAFHGQRKASWKDNNQRTIEDLLWYCLRNCYK